MVCAPVAGLRVPSSCRCTWQPQRLSPLGHRFLERDLFPLLSSLFPFSPVPKNKMILAVLSAGLKNKIITQGELNPSLPHSSTSISLLHCRRIQPTDGAVPSMQP